MERATLFHVDTPEINESCDGRETLTLSELEDRIAGYQLLAEQEVSLDPANLQKEGLL